MMKRAPETYTVGHGNMTLDGFITLLKRYGINCVVDMRRVPYSRFVPQFNRENLQGRLRQEDINYKFEGEALGGQPKERRTPENYQETYTDEGEGKCLGGGLGDNIRDKP